MATITIDSTDFDSYITLADAEDYMLARIGAAEWAAATDTTKNQGLVTATRWIYRYLQRLTDEDLIPDPADDPAPQEIQDATAELAYALIVDSTIQDKATATGDNNKVIQAGSVKVERFKPVSGTPFPSVVQNIINEWISDQGGATVGVGLASGTDGESEFDDPRFGTDTGVA